MDFSVFQPVLDLDEESPADQLSDERQTRQRK